MSGGEKACVLWELTLRSACSGNGLSGTTDYDICFPAVSCTRSSDPHPPRCPPRRNHGETCGPSSAVIPETERWWDVRSFPCCNSLTASVSLSWLAGLCPRVLRLAESVFEVLPRPQALSCYHLKFFTHFVFLQNHRIKLSTEHPRVKWIQFVQMNGHALFQGNVMSKKQKYIDHI